MHCDLEFLTGYDLGTRQIRYSDCVPLFRIPQVWRTASLSWVFGDEMLAVVAVAARRRNYLSTPTFSMRLLHAVACRQGAWE